MFDSYEKENWMKYFRFYRYDDERFIVCDLHNSPVEWETLNENTLNKKYLNSHD